MGRTHGPCSSARSACWAKPSLRLEAKLVRSLGATPRQAGVSVRLRCFIYSMTSSAIASRDGGMVSSRTFAAHRLITNWNFVGA
jgi:hypothetical protein